LAAVTFDAARAAREEAEQLRVHSRALRLAMEQSLWLATARKDKAAAAAAAPAQYARAPGSPWSRLPWLRDDGELDRVLVPLD
jgi:hypothetical protein